MSDFQKSIALAPCPFCGGEAAIGTVRWKASLYRNCMPDLNRTEGFFGQCTRCPTEQKLMGVGSATREEAAAKWNRRAPAPQGAAPGLGGAEAAKAAIQAELDAQMQHYSECAAAAAAGSRLYQDERDMTEGVIKGLEYAIKAVSAIPTTAAPAPGGVVLPSAPHHGGAFRIYAKIPPSGKPVEELPIANAVARELFSYAYGLEAEVGRLKALSAPAQGSPQEWEALECLGRLERLLSSDGFRMETEIAKIRRALSTAGRRDA